ncbi:hypothetical protein NPIL_478451 [Nephila pilipes]|uniref:Uncharacterized protein n=1 Tax=Nephila pilipes TaxID=299642 RepID=A0A8X6MFA7_NEPPI|nr:hypothetical protein NPIL_478451 [Nephila pilipes]
MHRSCPERGRAAWSTKEQLGRHPLCLRAKERLMKRLRTARPFILSQTGWGRSLRHQRCSRVINGIGWESAGACSCLASPVNDDIRCDCSTDTIPAPLSHG